MIIITTQNRNHNPSIFLIMVKLLLLLLCSLPLTAAQGGSSSPPPPPPTFNPSMAIVMVALVSAFFFMGFFSVYVRQCADRRYHGNNFHPRAAMGAGGRRSWRMQAGLDPEVIEAYFPTFLYSAVKGLKIGKGILECAVCLNEFEDDETLRLIPKCSHVFHPDCIGAWLSSHTTCPVCRANLIPTPGDLTLNSVRLFEPDNTNNNLVEAEDQSNVNNIDGAQNHVAIHVGAENDQVRETTQAQVQVQPPNVNLINQANRNRSLRSRSTGWQLNKLFTRSHSTARNLLVQPGENCERFTLRLSDEARNQLLNTHLNRARSCATFSKARSSRKGYRSHSVGAEGGRNYFNYERFNQEVLPEVFHQTTSIRSTKGVNGEENVTPSKNVLRSVRSLKAPLEFFFPGSSDKNNNNKDDHSGERSIDPLMPGSQV